MNDEKNKLNKKENEQLSEKEMGKVAGGGWQNSNEIYSSGETPLFHVGEVKEVRLNRIGTETAMAEIISVSDSRNGGFVYKEFTYTIRYIDSGKYETSVYESEFVGIKSNLDFYDLLNR